MRSFKPRASNEKDEHVHRSNTGGECPGAPRPPDQSPPPAAVRPPPHTHRAIYQGCMRVCGPEGPRKQAWRFETGPHTRAEDGLGHLARTNPTPHGLKNPPKLPVKPRGLDSRMDPLSGDFIPSVGKRAKRPLRGRSLLSICPSSSHLRTLVPKTSCLSVVPYAQVKVLRTRQKTAAAGVLFASPATSFSLTAPRHPSTPPRAHFPVPLKSLTVS